MYVVKRDGRTVPFDRDRIVHAIEQAWRAYIRIPYPDPIDQKILREIGDITDEIIDKLILSGVNTPSVEQVQDLVEEQLMASGNYKIARRYILYREARAAARNDLLITDGEQSISLHAAIIGEWLDEAHMGLPQDGLLEEVLQTLPPGPSLEQVFDAMIMGARTRIERTPQYTKVAAALLLRKIYHEVLGVNLYLDAQEPEYYSSRFRGFIEAGVNADRYDARLLEFDFGQLMAALRPARDGFFDYLGLQTLYDRYLVHIGGMRNETPQFFWMRVAMGLSLHERNPTQKAIEFYDMMSTFRYCPSTPTLFNAGTQRPQLSSCYLTTVGDDLHQIFKAYADNAQLSKWSGGIGNDWTRVRAMGSHIEGTNGQSQGIVPFLKIANDTAVAVNQGGKRKGATCAYLEPWHADVEEFLDLRRNTGDDRRRTHDMHTALWIPDCFLERVESDRDWSLFSPSDVPDLTETWGETFTARYAVYEASDVPRKTVRAKDLWRAILTSLFETGHPWITFKDRANERNPQQHAGMIRSSNLCTEITLNTSDEEIAVCNLASLNLATHVTNQGINWERLQQTIFTAVRGLDNVIDINFYPVPEAQAANLKHRPVGLGIMGWMDVLHRLRIPFASDEAAELADQVMEFIAYWAIDASNTLAVERGAYPSYDGSTWSQGKMPQDTLRTPASERLNWHSLRAKVEAWGVRNSNLLAIAPTATIANIQGVTQSIEPNFANLYVKSNLSGEFTIVNPYLVQRLDELGMWDDEMVEELKYRDGSVQAIARIPEEIKHEFATAFEIHYSYLINAAARRQQWIDQSQSLNLYLANPSGKELSEMYLAAWRQGLKTTYYLRTKGATSAEKSTIDLNKWGVQPSWMKARSASSEIVIDRSEEFICEACQ